MQPIREGTVTRQSAARRWATATLSDARETLPAELDALGDHAARCKAERGPLFRAQCALDAAEAFLTGRVVSVFVVAFVGLGLLYSLFV